MWYVTMLMLNRNNRINEIECALILNNLGGKTTMKFDFSRDNFNNKGIFDENRCDYLRRNSPRARVNVSI
jgi:hypothetical protein